MHTASNTEGSVLDMRLAIIIILAVLLVVWIVKTM